MAQGVVADPIAEVLADMRRRLTAQEAEAFTEVTRRYPDTLALLATFH